MKTMIFKFIHFRYCYYCLLLDICLIIGSAALLQFKMITPQASVEVFRDIIGLLLNTYVYLGYVRYSYLTHNDKFRKIIFAVTLLSIAHFGTMAVTHIVDSDKTTPIYYHAVPTAIMTALLCYAFRHIQTAEGAYFKKLATLNLFYLIIMAFIAVFFITGWASFLSTIITVIPAFIVMTAIWYWQVKLFKYLSTQTNYNEAA